MCAHIILMVNSRSSARVFRPRASVGEKTASNIYLGDDCVTNLKLRCVMFGDREVKQNKKSVDATRYDNNMRRTGPFSSHSTFFRSLFRRPTGHVRTRLINTRTRSRSRSMKSF